MASFLKLWKGLAIGVRDGAIDSVIARFRSGWQKFRDLVPMLASRDLLLGVKDRFCMSMQGYAIWK